ncbi:MAG: hypothetical protein J6W64_08795 [Bacilli bacterium]|nr:hypothetical protein [Bacilli bacterium]
MGNTFKTFFKNKNTVTILGIIIGVLVLYFSYNYRVKQAIEPVSVPYAKVSIAPTKEITAEMIGYVKVSSNFANSRSNLITNANDLIGKRVTTGTTIPANGLFYQEQVVSAEELPDAAFANIPNGYTIYALKIESVDEAYWNAIHPSHYIDLYLMTKDGEKLVYGKLIESIKVLDVKDSDGQHVFDKNGVATSVPSVFLFAVPDDMYLLLKKAELLGFKILPIPRNKSYTAKADDTEVKSQYLQQLILEKTYPLAE